MAEHAPSYNELAARVAELEAALSDSEEQQAAIASVLQTISHSPFDVDTVLSELAEQANELVGGDVTSIARLDDGFLRYTTTYPRDTPEAETVLKLVVAEDADIPAIRSLKARHPGFGTLHADDPVVATMAPAAREYLDRFGTTSAALLPMFSGDMPLGLLQVLKRGEHNFDEREKATLETLAHQAVIAIENARLFNELEERNREVSEALDQQTAVAEILQVIGKFPTDVLPVLDEITETVWRLFDVSGAILWRPVDGMLEAWSRAGPIVTAAGYRMPTNAPVAGWAYTQRRTVNFRLAELSHEDRARYFDLADLPLGEEMPLPPVLLAAPLLSGNKVLAVFVLARSTDVPFSPREVTLLETFADQAVIAIENARLFNELEARNREVTEALEQQTAIAEVLEVIAASPADLDTVLPELAAAAAKLCQADSVVITHGTNEIRRVWKTGLGHVTLQGCPNEDPADRVPGGVAFSTNRPVLLSGPIDSWAVEFPRTAKELRDAGVTECCMLAVPLRGAEGPMGAIVVQRNNAIPFTNRHVAIVETFADQAVIAIENVRLFSELQEKTEELGIASRHKSEFLANMSHELRTPLNAIIGYSELLHEEAVDLGMDDFIPDLKKIQTAGRHLLTLISGILDLSKIEAGRMTMYLEDFDIATLITETEDIARPLVEKNRNQLVIDCPGDAGCMRADLVKVRQVLFNLLSNAAKFTEDGRVEMNVRIDAESQNAVFAIRDTGIGMNEAQMARLFLAFSQADRTISRKYGGTGLGLALSRQFCVMMGGDITVLSSPGGGSTFTATIPLVVAEPEEVAPKAQE